MSTTSKPRCLHRFFVLNMAAAGIVIAIALYFTITGEYASLAERQQVEGMLNRITMAGGLYAILTWFADAYFSPRCRTSAD